MIAPLAKELRSSAHRASSLSAHAAIGCWLLLSIAGCGDSRTSAGGDGTGPLYLIATSFSAGDETETYLVTADSFDEGTTIDPTDGPKLLGGVVPLVRNGSVFVPDANGPVIVRYDVNADDKLVRGAELSFAGVGMTEIMSWHVYAISDTKAYVFDPAGPRIVVWNPSTMALAGVQIDLPTISRDGWTPNLVFDLSGPRRRGANLLIPLSWQDQDENSRFASGVLTIDTEADEVVTVDDDERCGEAYTSVEAPGGDLYFFPPDWSSTQHYFAEMHQPTCVLRVRGNETTFDETYQLDLSALGSGSAAAGAVPDGQTGIFFTTVDDALWADRENNGYTYWRFWHYDFASESSREVTSLPVWAGQPYYVEVGGAFFIPYWKETATGYRTTIYRTSGSDDPTPVFSFDANWYGLGRLR